MSIVGIRIDDRLIHGQVVNFWIPQLHVERVLIIDDEIAHDKTRKALLKLGCPAGCKASIFEVDKSIEKLKNHIDKGIRVMILARSPQPLLALISSGYSIDRIIVGNMSSKSGAKKFKNNVFIGPEEKKAFETLNDLGVGLYFKTSPTDAGEQIKNGDLEKLRF